MRGVAFNLLSFVHLVVLIIFICCQVRMYKFCELKDPIVEKARWRRNLPAFECRNGYPREPSSNRRDLILTCIRDRDEAYEYFLLTIRTTGCKARIIILTEVGHVFPDKYRMIIDYTDTEVVEMLTLYQLSNDFTRNTWILKFLEARRQEFNRIFICDAFDAWFQRDIFQAFNMTDRIVFISEDQSIGQQPLNKEWVGNCYGPEGVARVADNPILCHGTIYGPPELLYRYFKILMSEAWTNQCPLDQPKLQHLAHDGILEREGIKWELSGCTGPVLTMRQCGAEGKKVNGVMMFANRQSVIPHVAHQWNKQAGRMKRVMMRSCESAIIQLSKGHKPNWFWHEMRMNL